jgi:hypothetical protein
LRSHQTVAGQGIQDLGHGGQRHAGFLGDLRRRAHLVAALSHLGHDHDRIVGQAVEAKHLESPYRTKMV